ncbi:MAG TPA: ATP-binding cassette domain-containing protein [Candidatus Latescibacteria bacterium]|jgi:osmoprotectant transport system ATP-binding protein|nr:ABC transporter ATP-binding protein [Gemmatimonadaceae bacterium]MDP6018041.1 ATP-binding cassette domain-containing protein [Candidatus Latescibacterota bacterium]HJP32808.1 ATP-binding cassette domain-containing protein [Candidatus Latescibacterota bacterium]
MLELTQVTRSFGATVAVQPTDLSVRPGATTVLIGPSGCGKSTLLRLMIYLITPDRGSVRFEGTEFSDDDVLPLRHRMGYVIQDGGLFPHLSAADNVALLARHLSWDEARVATRLDELAELTRFPADGFQRFPAQLSGGQRQRVSLMRALMLDPDVLLLDEPLGALDPIVRSELQVDLRDIFRTLNKTVVMVTHDMGEAGFFGDVIVLMRDGAIVQQGTLAQLINEPTDDFVERFIRAQRTAHHVPDEAAES